MKVDEDQITAFDAKTYAEAMVLPGYSIARREITEGESKFAGCEAYEVTLTDIIRGSTRIVVVRSDLSRVFCLRYEGDVNCDEAKKFFASFKKSAN